jgi:hypothetical protein
LESLRSAANSSSGCVKRNCKHRSRAWNTGESPVLRTFVVGPAGSVH